jgi:hypothetical protein
MMSHDDALSGDAVIVAVAWPPAWLPVDATVCLWARCRGSGPGAEEEAQTIKFELPPVPDSVQHGESALKGFHFPTSEGFIFEAMAGKDEKTGLREVHIAHLGCNMGHAATCLTTSHDANSAC